MILLSAFYITKWYRADSTYGKFIHRDHLRANYPSNHPAIQPLHHSTLLSKYHHSSLGHRRYQSPTGPAVFKKRSRSTFSSSRGSFLTFRQTSAPMEETSCYFTHFLRTRSDTIAEKPTINQRKHRQPLLFPSDLMTGQGRLDFRPALGHSLSQQSISDL